MIYPQLVRLVHDRFRYRWKKVPFNRNLFVLWFDEKTVLVANREQGRVWRLKWKDVKITQFFVKN